MKSKWQKLIEYNQSSIVRGMLLKFPSAYPFESEVIMMICEGPENSTQRCLRTITGQKSGINCYQILPPEASPAGYFVSTSWLVDNWIKWIWVDGKVEDVLIRKQLTADEI